LNALIAGTLLVLISVAAGACSTAQSGAQGQWTFGPTLPPSSATPSGAAPAGSGAAPPASGNPPAGSPPAVPSVGPATSSAPLPSWRASADTSVQGTFRHRIGALIASC